MTTNTLPAVGDYRAQSPECWALELARARVGGAGADVLGYLAARAADAPPRNARTFVGAALPILAGRESQARAVWFGFARWLLVDPDEGVIQHCEGHPDCVAAIKRVAALCDRWQIAGNGEWESARVAAYDAADCADCAAANAAYSLSNAAAAIAYAAANAADAAAAAYVDAARQARKRHAEKLLGLLMEPGNDN